MRSDIAGLRVWMADRVLCFMFLRFVFGFLCLDKSVYC